MFYTDSNREQVAIQSVRFLNKKQGLHIRRSISNIKRFKDALKIVDSTIQKIVVEHIQKCHHRGKKLTYFDESGKPLLYVPNRRGEPVPIKKVRIRKEYETPKKAIPDSPINRYVTTNNNHHALIYKAKVPGSKEPEKVKSITIPFKEVVARRLKKLHIFQLPDDGKQLLAYLRKGDYFLLGIEDSNAINWNDTATLSRHLYRVKKISKNAWFVHHRIAAFLNSEGQLLPLEKHRIASYPKIESVAGPAFVKAIPAFYSMAPSPIPVYLSCAGTLTPRRYRFEESVS